MHVAEAVRLNCCKPKLAPIAPPGSRRRRLWELDHTAHCPLLGVCLPIEHLRKLADKALPGHGGATDYRLHGLAIGESRCRSVLSEVLHKELERRFAGAVREAAGLKSAESLVAWWRERRGDERMPGSLWAVLTHPRCDTVLEAQVLADVHMLQHQRGAAQRVEMARFEAVQADNAALRKQLEGLRQRTLQQTAALQAQVAGLQAQAIRLRADAVGRETLLAGLRDELRMLAHAPELKARVELAQQVRAQAERIAALERALARSRQDAMREPPVAPVSTCAETAAAEVPPAAAEPPPLGDRAVLCVGGRPASVPLYRHIVERSGGRFLHHDGGEEHNVHRLDATLSAADLVICQAACISHDAYWRVKQHCKRHNKRCVFVDNPGSASLRRALVALQA